METQTSMHAKTVHLPCPTNPALKNVSTVMILRQVRHE